MDKDQKFDGLLARVAASLQLLKLASELDGLDSIVAASSVAVLVMPNEAKYDFVEHVTEMMKQELVARGEWTDEKQAEFDETLEIAKSYMEEA